MCITGEKNLETVWKDLTEEFEEDLQWVHLTKDAIWNVARDREMGRSLTPVEWNLREGVQSKESIVQARFW